jgi:hypothetical protein
MKKNLSLILIILLSMLTACGEITPTQPTTANPTTITPATSPVTSAIPPDSAITIVPDPQNTVAFLAHATPIPAEPPGLNQPPPLPLLTPVPTTAKFLPKNHLVVANRAGLYLVGLDGKAVRLLVGGAGFRLPKIAPDGSAVVALRTDPISRKTVPFYVPTQGNARILEISTNLVVLNWEWSPDSKNLALTLVEDNNGDGRPTEFDNPSIWLYELATNKIRRLTNGANPVWSPDGKNLFYSVSEPLSAEIDPVTNKPRRNSNILEIFTLQNGTKRTVLNAKNLSLTTPEGQVKLRYFKATAWSADGKTLYVGADALKQDNVPLGVVLATAPENPTPRLISIGGDAIVDLKISNDGKSLFFETEPQFPNTAKSAYTVEWLNLDGTPKPAEGSVGKAVWQGQARSALWIENNRLAYLEGSNSEILTIIDVSNKNSLRLLSGCLGVDFR